MPTINDAFINALLADASYVDNLQRGITADVLAARLSDHMTPTFGKLINDNFTVTAWPKRSRQQWVRRDVNTAGWIGA